jgi:hypothetical protein
MIATIGLRIQTADSVPTAAIPVPLKGACMVGLAPSDPTAQPGISAVSVVVRGDLLADAPHVHVEAPRHVLSQDNMDDCALQGTYPVATEAQSSRARRGVQLKRKQGGQFPLGIINIACSSTSFSSRGTSRYMELPQF